MLNTNAILFWTSVVVIGYVFGGASGSGALLCAACIHAGMNMIAGSVPAQRPLRRR